MNLSRIRVCPRCYKFTRSYLCLSCRTETVLTDRKQEINAALSLLKNNSLEKKNLLFSKGKRDLT